MVRVWNRVRLDQEKNEGCNEEKCRRKDEMDIV